MLKSIYRPEEQLTPTNRYTAYHDFMASITPGGHNRVFPSAAGTHGLIAEHMEASYPARNNSFDINT